MAPGQTRYPVNRPSVAMVNPYPIDEFIVEVLVRLLKSGNCVGFQVPVSKALLHARDAVVDGGLRSIGGARGGAGICLCIRFSRLGRALLVARIRGHQHAGTLDLARDEAHRRRRLGDGRSHFEEGLISSCAQRRTGACEFQSVAYLVVKEILSFGDVRTHRQRTAGDRRSE